MAWVSDVRADIGEEGATLSSPAPRLGILCLTFVAFLTAVILLERALGAGPHIALAAIALGALAAALPICVKSFRTRFDRVAGHVTVETHSMLGRTSQRYPFAEVDALAATESNVVELQLRDGTTRRLSHAHETYPQLDRLIGTVCAATGLARGSPNLARAPSQDDAGVLSEPGMGLYIEGRFAILATASKSLSFRWVMEVVFNRERREMTVVKTTPLRRHTEVVRLREVASLGLDGTQDPISGAYAYRAVIRLENGRSVQLYGATRLYPRYDRILSKVRDLTGIPKEDNLYPFRDSWSGPGN
jgi:hypothetical protein